MTQSTLNIVDSAGNVYRAGTIATTSPRLFNEYDAWVAKYDSIGNQLWLKNFDFQGYNEYLSGLAVDNAGSIYLTGTALADDYILLGFGEGPRRPWVTKYDGSGNQLWLKRVESGNGKAFSYGMKVDSSSNVYLMGANNFSLPPARYSLNPSYTYIDTWATKYDSNGNQLWLQQLGTIPSGSDYSTKTLPSDLELDSAGNLYLTGTADGALGNTNNKSKDIWVTKYDSNGNRLWLKQFGSREDDSPSNLVVDNAGNLYLTGTTEDALGSPNAGSADILAAKYDSNGDRLWLQQFGSRENDTISGFDGNDRMYGNLGNDCLEGSKGDDSLYGGKGNDTLLGGNGEDVLMGDRASDSLVGGTGNDTLYGGKDDDTLFGGLGNDCLIGGLGSDRFLLFTDSGIDTIVDFAVGTDLLILGDGLTFSQLAIVQDSGATSIRIAQTGEILASLGGVSASSIGAANFG